MLKLSSLTAFAVLAIMTSLARAEGGKLELVTPTTDRTIVEGLWPEASKGEDKQISTNGNLNFSLPFGVGEENKGWTNQTFNMQLWYAPSEEYQINNDLRDYQDLSVVRCNVGLKPGVTVASGDATITLINPGMHADPTEAEYVQPTTTGDYTASCKVLAVPPLRTGTPERRRGLAA